MINKLISKRVSGLASAGDNASIDAREGLKKYEFAN